MKLTTTFKILIAIIVCELAGIIGSFFTMDAITTWYAEIVKPTWNPPSWVFGPVWITLYAMMGVAAGLVWGKLGHGNDPVKFAPLITGQAEMQILKQVQDDNAVRIALGIFGVQLFLNAIWSPIFFGLQSPGWALVIIIALWVAIVATMVLFVRISKPAFWLLVPYLAWVSFAGFLNYTIWDLNKAPAGGDMVFCTADAMQCPDGTYVGRSGPKCEFACPAVSDRLSWKTFTDETEGITFRYPEELGTTYMRAYDWPPQVAVTNGPFVCVTAGAEIDRAGRTELRMVDNRSYCVTKISEGAAGSIYTQYAYATERGSQTWVFTATVRATQCGNYDKPQKTECEGERETFDFDSVMDRIIQTATMR